MIPNYCKLLSPNYQCHLSPKSKELLKKTKKRISQRVLTNTLLILTLMMMEAVKVMEVL